MKWDVVKRNLHPHVLGATGSRDNPSVITFHEVTYRDFAGREVVLLERGKALWIDKKHLEKIPHSGWVPLLHVVHEGISCLYREAKYLHSLKGINTGALMESPQEGERVTGPEELSLPIIYVHRTPNGAICWRYAVKVPYCEKHEGTLHAWEELVLRDVPMQGYLESCWYSFIEGLALLMAPLVHTVEEYGRPRKEGGPQRNKSKEELFKYLESLSSEFDFLRGVEKLGLKHSRITDETYGNDSRIYVATTHTTRKRIEALLTKEGFLVHTSYWPEGVSVEVSVEFFKGHNWDE